MIKTPRGIWGLTGGIASGKSTVASFFAELGCFVIDADQIARELRSDSGEATPFIKEEFGTTDPAELKKIVFKNDSARKKLESILHPLIRKTSLRQIQDLIKKEKENCPPIIYEATLLLEANRDHDMDGVIVVQSTTEKQKERVLQRDGITPKLADQIIDSQLTHSERAKKADWLIHNDTDLGELKREVASVYEKIQKRGASPL